MAEEHRPHVPDDPNDETTEDTINDVVNVEPSTPEESKMWPLVDNWLNECEQIPPREKTTLRAQQANEKLMKSIESIAELKAAHARLSPSGRFWGASQFMNRLCKSAQENGITSLPRYPSKQGEAEGDYLPWSKIESSKKGGDTAFAIFGTLFGPGSNGDVRAQILLGAVMQAPSTKKVIRLS